MPRKALNAPDLPKALIYFDALPDIANVDSSVISRLYGCSMATIWRRVNTGDLPAPRKFGRSTRWNVGAIRAHLAGPITKAAA